MYTAASSQYIHGKCYAEQNMHNVYVDLNQINKSCLIIMEAQYAKMGHNTAVHFVDVILC